MWFKNIYLFQLHDFKLNEEELNSALESKAMQECAKTEMFSLGWCNPVTHKDDYFVHGTNGCFLIALCREDRLLPATVVRQAVAEKVQQISEMEDRKVYSREKANLRDEITFDLMPKAFTKKSVSYAYIDTKNQWMIVDAASSKKAEEINTFLRETLGSLISNLPETKSSAHTLMTNWLMEHKTPAPFLIEDSCELLNMKQGVGSIRLNQEDLTRPEVAEHIKNGHSVKNLSMSWAGKIFFTLSDDLSIKRIKLLDMLEERRKDDHAETPAENFDADFAIMNQEFALLLNDLFTALDGLVEPDTLHEMEAVEA